MKPVHLINRCIIRAEGTDVKKLLQGIITNNLSLLDEQPAFFSALLSPQGKFLADFFVIRTASDHQLLIDIDVIFADAFIKKMRLYTLRADARFIHCDAHHVYAVLDDSATYDKDDIILFTDPRHASMKRRAITQAKLDSSDDISLYDAHRLHLGIPDGAADAIVDKSLLLELGYDALYAIDFHKGCYIGQEVTARTKHRASLRKALHSVTSTQPLPAFGSHIVNHLGQTVGDIRSSHGQQGLAMLRLDAVTQATQENQLLQAENVALNVSYPAWMPQKKEAL